MFTLKISKLLISVYNNFKCGTLSAWPLPFRVVINLICNQLDPEK